MNSQLKVGLIGFGMMGKNHARVLSELDGVSFIGFYDESISQNINNSNYSCFSSFEELLSKNLDYCVVATPTVTHKMYGEKLSQRGINFILEKPMTDNLENAQAIIDAASEFRVIGAVGHIERFNPAVIEAKKQICEGLLGDIFQVITTRQGPYPGRILDVGVILDLATHDIDTTRYLTDSEFSKQVGYQFSRSDIGIEELVQLSGILESGVITSHTINWLSPIKERYTRILGQNGILHIDTLASDLYFFEHGSAQVTQRELSHFTGTNQGRTIRFAIEKIEPLVAEHLSFINSIRGLAHQNIDLISAKKTLEAALVFKRDSEYVRRRT